MKFLLDHDVPIEIQFVLARETHDAVRLVEVLPINTPDDQVFAYAIRDARIMITCNRSDYLNLAERRSHNGLIILIRRRSRQAECARVLKLLRTAGEQGISGNVNFA